MYFLVNPSPLKPLDLATSNSIRGICHMMREYWSDLDFTVRCQIMYFLVNASPPKSLDLSTSNSMGGIGHMM